MCIMMAALRPWLDVTIASVGFIYMFPGGLLAGHPVKGNQGKVDGDEIKLCVGEQWLDFVDDLEIEGNVLAAKRSHEDDDTSEW